MKIVFRPIKKHAKFHSCKNTVYVATAQPRFHFNKNLHIVVCASKGCV